MPIHEYKCLACGVHYEILVRSSSNLDEITCPDCKAIEKEYQFAPFASHITAIHASERPVILVNDKGEIRYPPTADAPIHPKYAAQGFRKQYAFETFRERDEFEKKHGQLHESSHYDKGSNTAEKDLEGEDPAQRVWNKTKHKLRSLGSL